MKRLAKKSLVAVVCAALAVVMLGCVLVGCSGGKESKGSYSMANIVAFDIGQGTLIQSFNDTLTAYSDETFSLVDDTEVWMKQDASVTVKSSMVVYIEGTYETVSENAELGESTVRLTDVTAVAFNGQNLVEGETYTMEGGGQTMEYSFESYASQWEGKEILLGSDGHMVVQNA